MTDAYDATLFPQYAILEAGGVRVGVIGFVTPHVPNWESPRLIEGLQFGDPVAVARRLVPSLRNQERCDVVVILTHQGFERDPATGEERGSDRGENQAYALATEVPGVDFVLAGHAHAVVAPRQIGGTWVSEPGRWGNTLTRYDVTLEKAGARWKITDVQGRNLHMKNVPPDPAVAAVVAPEHDAAMRALGEQLAVLETPVSAQGARSRDTALLDWLHQVQLSAGKAQLSFCSLLPAQLADWPAGPLTLRQVWAFYPYENSLVTVEATGRQVRAALERSAGCVGRPVRARPQLRHARGGRVRPRPFAPGGIAGRVADARRQGSRRRRRLHGGDQLVPRFRRGRLPDVEVRAARVRERQPPRPARGRRAREETPAARARRQLEGGGKAMIPEEKGIVDAFHRLYYDGPAGEGRVHHRTTWMGTPCLKCPMDLWAYQEILAEVRPDLVVETGTHLGGSALFLAHMLDLLGKGELVTVDILERPDRPRHPRIRYVTGSSGDWNVVASLFAGRPRRRRSASSSWTRTTRRSTSRRSSPSSRRTSRSAAT